MIINHRHRFIFLKTRKTASTSMEIALSAFCGPEAVITSIEPEDEYIRQELGYRGPQNIRVPLRQYSLLDGARCLWNRTPKQFFHHAPASFVKENVPQSVWDDYFVFCFERNPFDKAVSLYYWMTDPPRPPLETYLARADVNRLSNWPIYTINGKVAVDFVGRYEQLEQGLAHVAERLNLPTPITLPNAKAGERPSRQPYPQLFTPQARNRVEIVCARECLHFGYKWGQDVVSTTGSHSENSPVSSDQEIAARG